MKIKCILFDLDGTLVPMDQDAFVNDYFARLAKFLYPYGYRSEKLLKAIWAGTGAAVKNTGERLNRDVFWDSFFAFYPEMPRSHIQLCDSFYENDFGEVRNVCGFDARAAETVRGLAAAGYRVVLATNPIFPTVATKERIRWAGLEPEDFEFFTTFDNSYHCKPNPDYYRDIVEKLGCKPEECLMIGNDALEDMVAETLGMKVFLLTGCLINRDGRDISKYPQGGFDELTQFLKTI